MRGPEPAGEGPSGDRPLGVGELAARIERALDRSFPERVSVVGEVSGLRDRTHLYFDLKDERAVLSCVMFASAAKRLRFEPGDGARVIARGRVQFYTRQGRTQLYVERLEPAGEGDLDRRFRELCAELRALGWFEADRKRPLPPMPRRIAVITSRTGAALQDVLDTLRRRCPAVGVLVVDVRVQGDRAAGEIARAVRVVSRRHRSLGVDAVLLTRGGGSAEDLWAFNERAVAEAIVGCEIPVVAAIGHETDTTIAELVADERAATPTQAAMRLVPDRAALLEQLDLIARRLRHDARRHLAGERQRASALGRTLRRAAVSAVSARVLCTERLGAALLRHRPEAVFEARRARIDRTARSLERAALGRLDPAEVDSAAGRLARAMRDALDLRQSTARAIERQLALTSPAAVLERGFSVAVGPDGCIIRRRSDIGAGERMRTRVADGAISSIVEGGSPRRSRRTGARSADQMDLFEALERGNRP